MRPLGHVLHPFALTWLAAACGGGAASHPDAAADAHTDAVRVDAPVDGTTSVAMVVGPAGGHVGATGGPQLDIPAGALDAPTMITIELSPDAPPPGALSPLYAFGPSGTKFSRPVTVVFPLPPGTSAASVYWSGIGGTGLAPIGGTLGSDTITAEVTHFSDGGVGSAADTRTISGVDTTTYLAGGITRNVPVDLGSSSISVLAGSATIVGQGSADGTFTIEGVPAGVDTLDIDGTYYVTTAAALDIGTSTWGSPTAPLVTSANTAIDLDVTGMASWGPNDFLEAVSADANTVWFELSGGVGSTIPQGSTQLSGYALDTAGATYFGLPDHLIVGGVFFVDRLASRTAGSASFSTVTQFFEPPPVTEIDGSATTVSGTFTDVTQQSLDLHVQGTQWRAAFGGANGSDSLVNPNASSGDILVELVGVPTTQSTYTPLYQTMDWMLITVPDSGSDYIVPGLTYGIPPITGEPWIPSYQLDRVDTVSLALGSAAAAQVTLVEQTLIAFSPTVPIAPALGPVLGATITTSAGTASIFGAALTTNATPTLAWQPPTTGTARSYSVLVHGLTSDGTTTSDGVIAQLHTSLTSVTIPPGLLAVGETYAFQIDALDSTEASPNRQALPSSRSEIISNAITVAP